MRWFKNIKKFLYEVWLEAKPGGRVSWPGPKKLMESTLLVMACAFVFMVYIGVLDLVFEKVIEFLVTMFKT